MGDRDWLFGSTYRKKPLVLMDKVIRSVEAFRIMLANFLSPYGRTLPNTKRELLLCSLDLIQE